MIRRDDVIALPCGVVLTAGGIVDPVRGATLEVNAVGRLVLERPTTPARAARDVAARFGVDETRVLADVLAFCVELNVKLLLNVRAPKGQAAFVARWLRTAPCLLPFGTLPRTPVVRHGVDTSRVPSLLVDGLAAVAGVAGAYAAGAALAAALVLGTIENAPPELVAAAAVSAGGGVAVHELAHLALLRSVPACVAQRGLRVSVLHRPVSEARERAVAAAGPVVGSIVALALGVAATAVGVAALALASTVLGLQSFGLTVVTRDGRKLCGCR